MLAAFPVADDEILARRFIRLTLPRVPPWRLPGAHAPPARRRRRLAPAAARAAVRRRAGRGARAGAAAASRAPCSPRPTGSPRSRASRGVALDTGIENRAARALYQRSGFLQGGLRPVPDERSARAIGGSGFVGYVKRRA